MNEFCNTDRYVRAYVMGGCNGWLACVIFFVNFANFSNNLWVVVRVLFLGDKITPGTVYSFFRCTGASGGGATLAWKGDRQIASVACCTTC